MYQIIIIVAMVSALYNTNINSAVAADVPLFIEQGSTRTVVNTQTGEVWTKSYTASSWSGAASYCDNLVWAGYSDWRLPTMAELRSRINPVTSPTLWTPFSFNYLPYWSNESYNSTVAWALAYSTPKAVESLGGKSQNYNVSCIRGQATPEVTMAVAADADITTSITTLPTNTTTAPVVEVVVNGTKAASYNTAFAEAATTVVAAGDDVSVKVNGQSPSSTTEVDGTTNFTFANGAVVSVVSIDKLMVKNDKRTIDLHLSNVPDMSAIGSQVSVDLFVSDGVSNYHMTGDSILTVLGNSSNMN